MDIEDIIARVFHLTPHRDLRRAPEVCRKWRDVYIKKKMLLGWRAFEAGDVYGINRSAYIVHDAFYHSAIGGHFFLARFYASQTDYSIVISDRIDRIIKNLMENDCSTELIGLIPDGCDDASYIADHIGYVKYIKSRSLEPSIHDQIESIMNKDKCCYKTLREHYDIEDIMSRLNNEDMDGYCKCPYSGVPDENHDEYCEIDLIDRGVDIVPKHIHKICISSDLPLVVNKFLYDSQHCDEVYLHHNKFPESTNFILEKIALGKLRVSLDHRLSEDMLIRIFKASDSHRDAIVKQKLLENSMKGIEFLLENGYTVTNDRRLPPKLRD